MLIVAGTRAGEAYGRDRSTENFMCNYGVNEAYHDRLFSHGLEITGYDPEGNVRIVERPAQPFFMATLFLPQLSSQPGSPHPLIVAFLQAAAGFRESP